MATGKLVWAGKKKNILQVQFVSKKGKDVSANVKESTLSASLASLKANTLAQLDAMEVEFDLASGQPINIRQVGEPWQRPASSSAPQAQQTSNRPSRPSNSNKKIQPRNNQREQATRTVASPRGQTGDFHNPYNFVPAIPRSKATEPSQNSELGDRSPSGHGAYQHDLWSGHIGIKLTTKTPLLIPDAATVKEHENGHKTFKTRIGENGLPLLPATSLKGMLRAAYEIVTNSRLSIFEKHGDRLAYRMPAKMSAIPARIQYVDDKVLIIQPMSMAKLPRYAVGQNLPMDKGESTAALCYPKQRLPNHGKVVWVKVSNSDKVTDIKPGKKDFDEPGYRKGWVCLTGANISGKRFERVFLDADEPPLEFRDEDRDNLIQLWSELIKNYKKIHEKDLKKRQDSNTPPGAYLGDDPGETGWSRHIYEADTEILSRGTLCYLEKRGSSITALLPVTISRHLYDRSPESLLDEDLKPSGSIRNLSPADRVFGWVKRNDSKRDDFKTAYKGNLRISGITCQAKSQKEAIQSFKGDGVPLAILGAPKPEQARFYLARDKSGQPLAANTEKAQGYQTDQGLRGRKVYPHHQGLPDKHWENPTSDRTQQPRPNRHFQEYRRPRKDGAEQRDDQNRSMTDWVKQDVSFTARIDVTNLSEVELGALLYLLNLPKNHFHRLGGGKPLGFGSVQVQVDWNQTDLRKGSGWQSFYTTFDESQLNIQDFDVKSVIKTYTDEVESVYGNPFEQVSFIQAFLQATKGFDDQKPMHYPRIRQRGQRGNPAPHPDGESFKWFTENERTGRDGGDRLPLPSLLTESGLPYLDDKERNR